MRHRLASRSRDAEGTKQGVQTPLPAPKTTLLHSSQSRVGARDGRL
jgi:hypothetical protein